jgi:hypothetical protein
MMFNSGGIQAIGWLTGAEMRGRSLEDIERALRRGTFAPHARM